MQHDRSTGPFSTLILRLGWGLPAEAPTWLLTNPLPGSHSGHLISPAQPLSLNLVQARGAPLGGGAGAARLVSALAADGDHQAGSRSLGATLPLQSLVMSAARGPAPGPARGWERLSRLACPVSLPWLPPGALCVRKGPQGRWRGFKSRLPFTRVWPWAHCFPSGFDFVVCCLRVRRYLSWRPAEPIRS